MLLIGCAKQSWWLLCDLCIFTQWQLEGVLVEGNGWVGTRVLQCSGWRLGTRVGTRVGAQHSESTAPLFHKVGGVWAGTVLMRGYCLASRRG